MHNTFDFIPQFDLWLATLTLAATLVGCAVVRLFAGPSAELSRNWKLIGLRIVLIAALLLVLANPVRVSTNRGDIVPSDVMVLVDASASMSLDDSGVSRWSQAVDLMQGAIQDDQRVHANVRFFKFGRELQSFERSALFRRDALATADASDTQLVAALRQLTSRFGQRLPAGVVVLSDGRTRDAGGGHDVAMHYAELGVPIHVVPLGDESSRGDVSVISLIVPPTIRTFASVEAVVFLRSYGLAGRIAQVELSAIDSEGGMTKKLASAPVTLTDGFQSASLTFNSYASLQDLRVRITPLAEEMAVDNNACDARVEIDQRKLRILYLEGSRLALRPEVQNGRVTMIGPHSLIQNALNEAPEIECRVLLANGATMMTDEGSYGAFPRTATELFAYDGLILSNVPRRAVTDEQLGWLEEWVKVRGAGVCMVGGPNSFNVGDWGGSSIDDMLPVDSTDQSSWLENGRMSLAPSVEDPPQPIFRLLEDQRRNRELLKSTPAIRGFNAGLVERPALATVLATGQAEDADSAPIPAIVSGRYGRGRTLSLAFSVTQNAEEWTQWGGSPVHFARFWRNIAFWLTDQSFIGRRRLSAIADKQYYEPAETICLTAESFDDSARLTSDYRLVATVEPQSLDIDSPYAPLRWPAGVERTSGEEGPLMTWGEEFEIPVRQTADGSPRFSLDLQLADSSVIGQSSGVRLEIAAFDADAQIDSTVVPIQVLHDPFEKRNPFPNHKVLKELASKSQGKVIRTAGEFAQLLRTAPTSDEPPKITKSPAWSGWFPLVALLGLVTVDWLWRRRIGLA